MWRYFKPLRRKIGVVTLVLACVFSAGWLRSDFRSDIVMYDLDLKDDNWGAIMSYRQQLRWSHVFADPDNLKESAGFQILSYPVLPQQNEIPASDDLYRVEVLGFQLKLFSYTKGSLLPPYELFVGIPYWSIVFPLTLLSSCLLLSKPRARQLKPASEA